VTGLIVTPRDAGISQCVQWTVDVGTQPTKLRAPAGAR
jgi:hypothetical protein